MHPDATRMSPPPTSSADAGAGKPLPWRVRVPAALLRGLCLAGVVGVRLAWTGTCCGV